MSILKRKIIKRKQIKKLAHALWLLLSVWKALSNLLNRAWHQLFFALLLSPLLSFTHRSPLNYCVWQKSLHLGPPPSMIPSSSSPWQKRPVFSPYFAVCCCDSAFRFASFFLYSISLNSFCNGGRTPLGFSSSSIRQVGFSGARQLHPGTEA